MLTGSIVKQTELGERLEETHMGELLSLAIQILIENPLTVSLVILGVICVVLAIVGRIPPMHIVCKARNPHAVETFKVKGAG